MYYSSFHYNSYTFIKKYFQCEFNSYYKFEWKWYYWKKIVQVKTMWRFSSQNSSKWKNAGIWIKSRNLSASNIILLRCNRINRPSMAYFNLMKYYIFKIFVYLNLNNTLISRTVTNIQVVQTGFKTLFI